MDRPLSSILVVALLVVVVGSISPTHDPPSPTGHPVRPGTGPSPGPGPSNSGLPAAPARSTPLDLGSAHPGVVHPAITSALTVIYPNGTISNLSAPINVSGNTYAITANFTGGLEIERNHTFLRGNDWTLTTDLSLSVGVIVDNASGVTVRSLTVEGGTTAFLVVNSAYIHLQSDRAVGSTGWAVQVASSGNVSVTGCSSDSGEGFYADYAAGLNLSGNLIGNSTFFGIFGEFASGATVANNQITGSFGNLLFANSVGVTITGNHANGGDYGLYFYAVTDTMLRGNFVNGSLYAVYADASTGLSGTGDRATNATESLLVYDSFNLTFSHEAFGGAVSEGLDLEYSSDVTFLATNFSGVGFRGAWVIYSTNITFQSVDLSRFGAYGLQANNSDGLSLLAINASDSNQSGATGFSLDSDLEVEIANSSSDATAWGVVATGDGGLTIENSSFVGELTSAFAVLIESSRSVTVRSDNLSHASGDALYVESSAGVTIADNDLTYAGAYALVLSGTAQVQADGNDLRFAASASAGIFSGLGVTVTNERGGDSTQPYGVGFVVASGADVLLENDSAPATNVSFELSGAADVQLLGSNGSDSYVGVQFSNVNGATVAGNTFDNDRFGFSTGGDFGVMVYHNNFVNDSGWMNPASAEQVTWDHGYPGGGNFWGNWTGPDLRSGPFQDLTGADGLVDTPLTINGSNVDRYPLTRPWTEHTIAFSETGLGPGTAWSIDVAGTVLRGTSPVLVYSVVNASNESLPYRVVPVPGYVTLSAPTGTVAFNGTDLLVPVRFSPYTYPVSFHESGLAEGTAWSVSFDSSSLLTDFPDANTTAPNGSYAYSVANVSGYALTTPGGTVTVDAAGVVVPILFVEIVHPTVYHNQTVYQNETIYDNGTGGSGGSNGSGNGGSGGGGGGTSAAKPATSPAGYSPMVVYALIAALAALAVLAALGFVLYGRARNRAPPTPAQPWSPPPAPTGTSAPPPGATGAAVAAIPAVGAAVRPAGAPDWREDP